MASTAAQYLCLYCSKSFASVRDVGAHEDNCEVEVESPPVLFTFPCTICPRKFARHSDLLIHQSVHAENSFICSHCNVAFSSVAKLHKHQTAQHTGVGPFICGICQKGFKSEKLLNSHQTVHTGEKPHECPVCRKCFSRPENLYTHSKLHLSGRRFFCSQCGKWFSTQDGQVMHEADCGGSASIAALRYTCSFCDKRFHYIRDRTVHERIHTGDKPYSCGYCSKRFTQSQALTNHIRTHTKEKPYTCGDCGTKFGSCSILRKHEYLRHPPQPPVSSKDCLSCLLRMGAFNSRKSTKITIELTSEEKNIIAESWRRMLEKNDVFYAQIFKAILSNSYRIRRIFELNRYSTDEKENSRNHFNQSQAVGDFLNRLIVELKLDSIKITAECINLGARHTKYRHIGFHPADLVVFTDTIADHFYLCQLAKCPTETIVATWRHFLTQVTRVMTEAYKVAVSIEMAPRQRAVLRPDSPTTDAKLAEVEEKLSVVDLEEMAPPPTSHHSGSSRPENTEEIIDGRQTASYHPSRSQASSDQSHCRKSDSIAARPPKLREKSTKPSKTATHSRASTIQSHSQMPEIG